MFAQHRCASSYLLWLSILAYLMAILLDFKWFHRWFICSSLRWISAASSWLAPPLEPSSICLIIFLPVAVRDKKFSLSVSISNCRSWKNNNNKNQDTRPPMYPLTILKTSYWCSANLSERQVGEIDFYKYCHQLSDIHSIKNHDHSSRILSF